MAAIALSSPIKQRLTQKRGLLDASPRSEGEAGKMLQKSAVTYSAQSVSYRQRGEQLSSDFAEMLSAINKSRKILELKDDWDGEGSLDYTPEVWNRAISFLFYNALEFWHNHALVLAAPKIQPGPDGTIDLHWELKQRELLLNIPSEPNESATFYGDDASGHVVKGEIDTTHSAQQVMLWLMQ